MRFISYDDRQGPAWGAVREGGVVSARDFAPGCATLREGLAAKGIAGLAAAAATGGTAQPLGEIRLLPTLHDARHVLCIGQNYEAHSGEAGKQPPETPRVFLRATRSLAASGGIILRPGCSEQLDYEGELAVVIGRAGRCIRAEDAMGHVAGYTCFLDGSVRDFQKHSLTAGKNFPQTGVLGPWLVTCDEAGPWDSLTLTTEVNGERVQQARTSEMVIGVPRIIAYVSTFIHLQPGDVIATGTPAGVGSHRDPKRWLRAGDRISVAISGIGTLSGTVADDPRRAGAD